MNLQTLNLQTLYSIIEEFILTVTIPGAKDGEEH